MRPPEVIEHGPVTLRRFREDDLDAVFAAVTESLDHLRPWLPWAAAGYIRQPFSEPTPAGTGVGVIWRLTRPVA